jgi:hypothetical protein
MPLDETLRIIILLVNAIVLLKDYPRLASWLMQYVTPGACYRVLVAISNNETAARNVRPEKRLNDKPQRPSGTRTRQRSKGNANGEGSEVVIENTGRR